MTALSDRPRVLVFVNRYPSSKHPAQGAFVREHARAAAAHADVVVLCNDGASRGQRPARLLEDGVQDGVRTIRLSYRRPLGPLPHLHYRLALRDALRRLRADGFRPDVVHAHYYLAGGTAVRIARRRGIPIVISEHSSTFPAGQVRGHHRWRAKRALERATLVCPVSAHLEDHIRATGIEARFRVVPNAVDPGVFRPAARPARRAGAPAQLAFVAVIRRGKGLDELLQALATLRDEPWLLEVAGGGPGRPQAELQAERLGLGRRVRFLGELAKQEVADLLRRSDVFVLPSHAETQGVAAIEATACGVPVIATRVGGLPEVVDGGSGVLVPVGSPRQLASALREAIGAPERYDREAIAQRAHERFGYANVGRQLSEIYHELIHEAGA